MRSVSGVLRPCAPPPGGAGRGVDGYGCPAKVDLLFSEALEPRFSTVPTSDAASIRVDRGDLHVVDGDGKHLAIGLKSLRPGTYTVEWHATSVDTHKTEGSFTFTDGP